MTLGELREAIAEIEPYYDSDIVMVVTDDPGFPARSGVTIKSTVVGFDWDMGRFLLFPSKPLIRRPSTKCVTCGEVIKGSVYYQRGVVDAPCHRDCLKKAGAT